MTVNLRRRGAVATVELNRPEVLNAWNAEVGEQLLGAIDAAAADDAVRAVVITGAGRAFSAGADLKAPIDIGADGHPDFGTMLRERYHPIIAGIRELPKPVVAAVNGPAAGIGCSLALACDLVLAAESSYFLLPFVNLGLAPDGGASLLIPARVGFARYAEMAMLGERVPAGKALEWSLVNRVVADDELATEAAALADRLAAGPKGSYAGIKRQLNAWLYARMHEQLELEAAIQHDLGMTEDLAEGFAAFASRRPARFTGR